MRVSARSVSALILFCASTAWAQTQQTVINPVAPSGPIYITHVTVIDTETGKEFRDRTVHISGDRISEVKESKDLALPTGVKIVDGTNKYLIPGLWDMHVHGTKFDSTLPLYIANGVTGVREMFGPPDANKFRAELAAKHLIAPHIYLASPIVDGKPPIVPNSIEVATADEARRAVDEQKQRGADFIKVYSLLSRDAYFAIIDEARRQNIPVDGHVPNSVSIWEATAAKQRTIEHLFGVELGCSSREKDLRPKFLTANPFKNEWDALLLEAWQSYSNERCKGLFAELKKNGTWPVPTLVVRHSFGLLNDPQFTSDNRVRYFSGEFRDWVTGKLDARMKESSASDFAVIRETFTAESRLTGELFRAGVPMLAGTDVGNPFCFPGFSLHDELALLVESGVSPLGALQMATRNPALFMDTMDKYGSVTPGKIADLVLLDADPLQDIHNTTKISEVFLDGKEFDRKTLDLILKNAEQEATASLKLSPADAPTNPFVGAWKLVPERSHFEGTAPKDIKVRFLIDKDELREEEELTRSNGSTRTAVFIPKYDGVEHPFTMSGETKHKSHAALWTRTDDRTIERRINHDNGLEYTTERLSVSPDGETLTETHFGKRADGTSYEIVIVLQRDSKTPSVSLSPAEKEVWDQEESYWHALQVDDRESFLQLWDERFMGWPRYDSAPADKDGIRHEFAPGTGSRGKVLDYKLEPLSVREYGKEVVITFYRAKVTRGRANREVETRTSRLTHTWMKTDQGWKIIGGMSADDSESAGSRRMSEIGTAATVPKFASAQQITAALNKPENIPGGGTSAELANGSTYRVLVVRRTAPGFAEEHGVWADILCVISGGGLVVTGGSLVEATESAGGELRGRTVTGGEEHRIAKGDVVTIPAGMPHWVRPIDGAEIVYLVLKASSRPSVGPSKATFVSASQIQSAVRGNSSDGLMASTFDDTTAYSTEVVRRTAPGKADVHSSWTHVYWVLRGGGVLVTGGSLIAPHEYVPGEFLGSGISGGEEHHISAGDLVVIPAGVPHWVRAIDAGGDLLYLAPKVAAEAPSSQQGISLQNSTTELTGKMAIYNSLLGHAWTCTAGLPAMSGQPAHTEKDKVTFSIAPQNVLLIEVSSLQFAGRNFIGFDSKSNQYWRTEMGVFGGLMRETSADGTNFSGKSSLGETWESVRSVLTTVQPDETSSDTEWWARNGTELTFTSRWTR